jgi:N utilization substance protein B
MAWEFRDEADRALASLVTDWPTHRQPVVDRNVLRLAFYEMLHGGVPHAAAIDQAVELAREFGGERSPAFVNAVLDRWWKNRGEAN